MELPPNTDGQSASQKEDNIKSKAKALSNDVSTTNNESSTSTTPNPNNDEYRLDDLQIKMIELEHKYLTDSNFHTDELRDRIIQYYLVLSGAAITIIFGLAQLPSKTINPNVQGQNIFGTGSLSAITLFFGIVGFIMVLIFVRLRRIAIECLQGTILLKLYSMRTNNQSFRSSFLWDEQSLPVDEGFFSASFLLVLIVMFIDSTMFALSVFLLLYEKIQPSPAGMWSLGFGITIITIQILLYRILLWRELRRSLQADRFWEKYQLLCNQKIIETRNPKLLKPLIIISLIGFTLSVISFWIANNNAPWSSIFS